MLTPRSVDPIWIPTGLRTLGGGHDLDGRVNLAGCENSRESARARAAIDNPDPGWLVDHWDAQDATLRGQLGEIHDVPAGQVFLTSGALGAVRYVFDVFTRPGTPVGLLRPDWPGFKFFGEFAGAQVSYVHRPEFPFHFGVHDVADFVRGAGIEFLIMSNPSAVTGHLWSAEEIGILLAGCPETLFVIDEADAASYPPVSAAHLARRYDNALFIGSFSKFYGLSGLRIGWMVTPAVWAHHFASTINPAELSPLAIVAAREALTDINYQVHTWATTKANLAALEAAVAATSFELVPGSRCFAAYLWADDGTEDPRDFLDGQGIDIAAGGVFGLARGGRVNLADPAKIATLVAALDLNADPPRTSRQPAPAPARR